MKYRRGKKPSQGARCFTMGWQLSGVRESPIATSQDCLHWSTKALGLRLPKRVCKNYPTSSPSLSIGCLVALPAQIRRIVVDCRVHIVNIAEHFVQRLWCSAFLTLAVIFTAFHQFPAWCYICFSHLAPPIQSRKPHCKPNATGGAGRFLGRISPL